jgi:hypothetical protein
VTRPERLKREEAEGDLQIAWPALIEIPGGEIKLAEAKVRSSRRQ